MGKKMETETDFIFLGSKITGDSDCSHEISKQKMLACWKESYDKPRQYTSRDITLPTKVRIAKVMVFLVVMYRCESWTIKKTECWRTDAFELWCWRTLLRVSWTARRSNQSILKEINWIFTERTDAEAEALILWPPEVRADWLEKTWERLKATGEGGSRGWDD